MRSTARVVAFVAVLAVLVAGLYARHAVSRIAGRARSLAASWRRPQPRHARPQPVTHLAYTLSPNLDILPVPFPASMPAKAPELTVIDTAPSLVRPYVTSGHRKPGRRAA